MDAEVLLIVLATVVLVAAAVAAMAIGVMFRRPCLRGSCGGPPTGSVRDALACATCPNRRKG